MKTTNNVIEAVNQMFDDDEETDFAIKGEFRKMRTSRKIRMPGGLQRDERIYDPVDRYRVEVFRRVIDQITTSIIERFSNNHELVTDAVCFVPRREKMDYHQKRWKHMQSSWFGQAGTEQWIAVFHPKLWQPFKNFEWRVCNSQRPRTRTDTSNSLWCNFRFTLHFWKVM